MPPPAWKPLGNPTRLKIYRILVRAGEEGMAVGRLQERLDIAASTLSHHLKALVAVGLVTQTREGTTPGLPHQLQFDARPDRVHGRGMLRRGNLPAGRRDEADEGRLNFFAFLFRWF
jgi:DNA-binding transcriptional ArsR family regulator